MNSRERAADELLTLGAVFLRPDEPFTWASGIKSPVYCDNRLILTEPKTREYIENCIAEAVKTEFGGCELLMGTATAGIAHAAIAAHILGLPMGYVRSDNKSHGRQNRIEGRVNKGAKTVVIEDLVSTGGSVISAVEALRKAGADVIGVISIFTYGMKKGIDAMNDANVKYIAITDFDTVCDIAAKRGLINTADIERLLKFRDNPSDESWINK